MASCNRIARLLSAYGLPTLPTFAAASAEETVRLAKAIGKPVALKPLTDPDTPRAVAHASRRDLSEAEAVSRAFAALEDLMRQKAGPHHFRGVIVQPMVDLDGYKLFAGSRTDPLFGPVVLFGFGGRLTEVFKDRAYALPPLTPTLARRMMERTRIYQALKIAALVLTLGMVGRRAEADLEGSGRFWYSPRRPIKIRSLRELSTLVLKQV
ncbi:MAG: acetate--CoA ligase family protein [Planctomycetaceae bacterium]|nr:acetate--CoA ligase family protein [Planctomycetaceae bacterium]